MDTLGWAPEISLDDGLERCRGWMEDNLDYFTNLEVSYAHKP